MTATDSFTTTTSVAVVDGDDKIAGRLVRKVGAGLHTATFESLHVLDAARTPGFPLVVVLGPSFGTPDALSNAGTFLRLRPELRAVLVVEELSTVVLQHAIRAGIADVLPLPVEGNELAEAVERASSTLSPATFMPAPAGGASGRTITVFSTKGGTGKSVIASNLAIALAKRADGPVALLDADLQFGDVAVMLQLNPTHTIVDAVGSLDRLDAGMLRSLLIRHDPSGVLVLPAPLEPAFADQVSPADLNRIIELLQSFCSYVVVDTPAQFNEIVLSLIDTSDDIVLIAGMDVPSIKNVKIGLQTLRLLDVPLSKLKLVLNRANAKVKLEVSEVERTLQLKADSLVPSDIVVPQSVNKGVPVVLDAPRSNVARSLEALADMFVETGARKRPGR